jgi:hypothetical protein
LRACGSADFDVRYVHDKQYHCRGSARMYPASVRTRVAYSQLYINLSWKLPMCH